MKKSFEPEKEKYAKLLEHEIVMQQQAAALKRASKGGRRIPLGKHVTQVEMTNPEARRQLKEMLEH